MTGVSSGSERPERKDPPTPKELRDDLWSTSGDSSANSPTADRLLEQYKLYVEMADRVSARRSLANTFFLGLNTAIFALIGALAKDSLPRGPIVVLPALAFVAQCAAWYFILRSYRQLNSAKYAVVGALEERLPASPYWRAEWKALGEGRDRRRYWPLSHLEQWIPVGFAALYLSTAIVLMITS